MRESAPAVIVNGVPVPLEGEKNLLEVVRKAGIDLPTLCYHEDLSVYGGCRQCVVETERGQIVAACSTPPQDGLRIRTHSPRLRKIRRMALELTLANHDRSCTTCGKSGNCALQDLARSYGLDNVRFPQRSADRQRDLSALGLTYDPGKCILCGACVRVCQEVQGVGAIDLAHRGAQMSVSTAFEQDLGLTECVQCGQCAAICPTGALLVKSDLDKAWTALHDPGKYVVVQIAPAVRVAIGEAFGMEPGELSMGRLVRALRLLGADRVFDTVFAADLTVMEETAEFLSRLEAGENLPLFTSCCPGWVKFVEHNYPELLPHLSSCKSPQQMFGAVIKGFEASRLGMGRDEICVISIMPCTAKKFEAARPEFATEGVPDVDIVLTTQEIAEMIRESGIRFQDLDEDDTDTPYGVATGAGTVFGATGGVAEAVLRAAHWVATGENLDTVDFTAVRGLEGVRTITVDVKGREVRVGVTHTLSQARRLIEAIKAGEAAYDIVEVMACPGGCVGGGGQPYAQRAAERYSRARGLYLSDRRAPLRRSQENPAVAALYRDWLGEPNSELAHRYLHTTYTVRTV